MSQSYRVRPSEMIGLVDDYEAYCFDEACLYILNKIQDKQVPHFEEDAKVNPLLRKMEQGLF